jgi:hypothetical protein
MATRNTKIDPVAREHLTTLKARLLAEFGERATNEDIVSALVCEATSAQLFGTLKGYHKDRAATTEGDAAAPESA